MELRDDKVCTQDFQKCAKRNVEFRQVPETHVHVAMTTCSYDTNCCTPNIPICNNVVNGHMLLMTMSKCCDIRPGVIAISEAYLNYFLQTFGSIVCRLFCRCYIYNFLIYLSTLFFYYCLCNNYYCSMLIVCMHVHPQKMGR